MPLPEQFDIMSNIRSWVKDCCVVDRTAKSRHSEIYPSFDNWCDRHDQFQSSKNAFSRALKNLGFSPHRYSDEHGYKGIKLKPID